MILGVNGIRLVGKRSGVGRCIEAILSCLGRMEHPFSDIKVYTPTPLSNDVVLPAAARNVVLPSHWPLAVWEQVTLPKAHGRQNVLLCPSYVIPFFARCPTLVIHHGSYEGYPQAFSWWELNKARVAYCVSARLATVVTTVSEHSKKDMVRFYGINPERVHVVPEGVDTTLFRHIDNQERLKDWRVRVLGSDTPYIVYVGKPTERRNLSSLIKAFSLLKKQNEIPHKLLIVGAELPGTSPFRQVIISEGLSEQVVVVGYADHQEMVLVYNAADLFVYPSSYEGFGMPVLEAMACGTPVIALDNTSLPEIAGGVAHLLNNAEVATLKEGIKTVLGDPAMRKRMSADGPKRAAAYDWQLVTKRYLELMIPLAVSQSAG